MPKSICKLFIGGGGDNLWTHQVEYYAADYERANPTFTCKFASYTNRRFIDEYIRSLPANSHITIVGHSYGAHEAFRTAQWSGRMIDKLISIDPVGRIGPAWSSVRPWSRIWLNVRAEPQNAQRTGGDWIADRGGKYPRPPWLRKVGGPDYSIIAKNTHGDFRGLMRANRDYRNRVLAFSGQSLLSGNFI